MSLETALASNNEMLARTNAILEQLIAALLQSGMAPKIVAELATPAPQPAPVARLDAPEPEPATAPQDLSYEAHVRPALLELAKHWKDPLKLAEFLGGFGVTKGPELRAEQFPTVINAVRDIVQKEAA